MVTVRTFTEEWGIEYEHICVCDKCNHEVNEEDLFEYDGETLCADCLKEMFPYQWDDELGDCLVVDGELRPVDELESVFVPVNVWDEKWLDRPDEDARFDAWRDKRFFG